MSVTETHEDKRKALDAFAAPPANGSSPSMVPAVAAMSPIADRVFGAQRVAVYRDETRVLQKLAALGAAAGDDWFYRYPVKNKRENRTDWIEGPSIKLANDVARIYGNCEVDTRVFDLGDNWLIYARFSDFESGYSLTRPFQQRKGAGKIGGEGGDADARRLDIAFQIGVSKAIRNVVVNALQTYADYAFSEARNSLVEKIGKNLDGWRARTLEGLSKIPVEVTRVERMIGKSAKEWLAPDVARIIAMMKAIADGMASADETFPALDAKKDDGGNTEQPSETVETKEIESSSQAGQAGATGQAASGEPSPQPPSQGSAAASVPEAAKAAETTAAKGGGKADEKNDAPPPKTEKDYIAYANAWREAASDPVAAMQKWKDEKKLRNSCNVGPDNRDDLLAKLQKHCNALQAKEG